jgi:hypothetical protein
VNVCNKLNRCQINVNLCVEWQGRFPATSEVKRRLAVFTTNFTQSLIDKYTTLPHKQQLAGLSVALRVTDDAADVITLADYVTVVKDVPIDFLASTDREGGPYYAPTLPDALVLTLAQGRSRNADAEIFWQAIARDIVNCIATETAVELTRMFEYQIAIACDDATVRLMAEYAADCIVAAATAGTGKQGEERVGIPLDRNVALFAVVTGTTPDQPHCVTSDVLTRQLSAVVQGAKGGQQVQ